MTTSTPGPVTIEDLVAGQDVEGVFLCHDKTRARTRPPDRRPYLNLRLQDATGSIGARLFDGFETYADGFDAGDAVRIVGIVQQRTEGLTIKLASIVRVEEAEAEALLPTSHRDHDDLDGRLEFLTSEVFHEGYVALLDLFLADGRFREELRRAPCTRKGHYAYRGGLLEHTVAVAMLAHELCTQHPTLNSDLLITAAVLHDIGKTRAFTYGPRFELSLEGRLLDHAAVGADMVRHVARQVSGLAADDLLALIHCIAMHHLPPGERFQLPEAKALYLINTLDTGVKGELEHRPHVTVARPRA